MDPPPQTPVRASSHLLTPPPTPLDELPIAGHTTTEEPNTPTIGPTKYGITFNNSNPADPNTPQGEKTKLDEQAIDRLRRVRKALEFHLENAKTARLTGRQVGRDISLVLPVCRIDKKPEPAEPLKSPKQQTLSPPSMVFPYAQDDYSTEAMIYRLTEAANIKIPRPQQYFEPSEPARPARWIARDKEIMESPRYQAEIARKRLIQEKRYALECERLEKICARAAALHGAPLEYVPIEERWKDIDLAFEIAKLTQDTPPVRPMRPVRPARSSIPNFGDRPGESEQSRQEIEAFFAKRKG